MRKQRFYITGMSCSACSTHVEKSVSKLNGMQHVTVNLLTNTMQTEYLEDQLSQESIIAAVEHAGYGATPEESTRNHSDTKLSGKRTHDRSPVEITEQGMKKRLLFSICFWLPLMYISMYHMFYEWFGLPIPDMVEHYLHGTENAITFAFLQFLLLLPILFVNQQYFRVGFKTLWKRTPTMDSLIAIGAGAAVVYGIFAIFRMGYANCH
ncbi:MAG: cation transporter [Lachnospiraceae bacterium]